MKYAKADFNIRTNGGRIGTVLARLGDSDAQAQGASGGLFFSDIATLAAI
jgi:hypothetical protein